MDLDEPELSEAPPGESPEEFRARILLTQRVLPILRDLVSRRFSLVIESDRRSSETVPITSDFVLEYGDSRVRLVLGANDPDPMSSGRPSLSDLRHFMLDVPDTDAVAVVADNSALSTWVFDVYGLQADSESAHPMDLGDALAAYFDDTVHPIELPNFRHVLNFPSSEELATALEHDARAAFEKVRSSRARIEEKVRALGQLSPADCQALVDIVLNAFRNREPSLSLLLDDSTDDH